MFEQNFGWESATPANKPNLTTSFFIKTSPNSFIFKDFAHSPSKVEATTNAVKNQYQERTVFACLEFAKNHFYERLNESQDGKVIYKPYLSERGINQQSIDKFYIGLSGTEKTHLLQEGLKNGYTALQLFDAGLVKKINEDQGVLESNLRDTFIERIVFPIYNVSGKVLGFGGRIIKTDTKAPKYLNSPETLVYEKRKELYGLSISKNEIRKADQVFLVEGYMDVVSLNQSGVENVVAASGTAFTEEQARLLKRFTHNIHHICLSIETIDQ